MINKKWIEEITEKEDMRTWQAQSRVLDTILSLLEEYKKR